MYPKEGRRGHGAGEGGEGQEEDQALRSVQPGPGAAEKYSH